MPLRRPCRHSDHCPLLLAPAAPHRLTGTLHCRLSPHGDNGRARVRVPSRGSARSLPSHVPSVKKPHTTSLHAVCFLTGRPSSGELSGMVIKCHGKPARLTLSLCGDNTRGRSQVTRGTSLGGDGKLSSQSGAGPVREPAVPNLGVRLCPAADLAQRCGPQRQPVWTACRRSVRIQLGQVRVRVG